MSGKNPPFLCADEGVQGKRRRKAIKNLILLCASEENCFFSRRFPWEIKRGVLAQRVLFRLSCYRYLRCFASGDLMITITRKI